MILPNKIFVKTYGCQMNFHDSERIQGLFQQQGYALADGIHDADVVLVNTCAVREKPERKLMAELGRLRAVKRANPKMVIGVTGCMAPRDGDIIRSRAPFVDLLVGPRSLSRLPDLVRQVQLQRQPIDSVDLFDDPTPLTPVRRSSAVSAWVDIIYGCSYACTFCAVPTARGAEVSRPPQQILDEIDELVALGYREITLLGQTVNAYGRDLRYRTLDGSAGPRERVDFSWLLGRIDARAPNLRVRFTSPHPQLFTDRLIRSISELPTVCEHVHLPLQSADDRVLRRMNRCYTYARYLSIVDKLRAASPGISITTDLIVGFPGETEAQFQKTLQAVRDVQFDQAFMFAYSPRRHTAAMEFADTIPAEVQNRRLQELIALVNDTAHNRNEQDVGRVFDVLVEGPSEKNPRRLSGRTRTNKLVVFDGSRDLIGQLVPVKTKRAFLWGFDGEVRKLESVKVSPPTSVGGD